MGLVPYQKGESWPLQPCAAVIKRQLSKNQEEGSHQTPHLPTPRSWTCRLQNYEKSVSVVYKKKKISQGKNPKGQNPGVSKCRASVVLSWRSHTRLPLPALTCRNGHDILPADELTQAWCTELLLELECVLLTGVTSSPQPLGRHKWHCMAKRPIINGISDSLVATAPGKQRPDLSLDSITSSLPFPSGLPESQHTQLTRLHSFSKRQLSHALGTIWWPAEGCGASSLVLTIMGKTDPINPSQPVIVPAVLGKPGALPTVTSLTSVAPWPGPGNEQEKTARLWGAHDAHDRPQPPHPTVDGHSYVGIASCCRDFSGER